MRRPTTLAALLRSLRVARGFTQAELAERAGISERAVSDIERGLRLHVYRDTAQRLVKALEVEGGAAAEFEEIARGRDHAAWQPADSVPRVRTALIGREEELSEVSRALADSAIVTIAGPGGVGKTRLAIELCRRSADDFPDGIAFLPLGELPSADLLLPALAGALKVRSSRDPLEGLMRVLRERRLLIVLDTFEHLLAAAPVVASLFSPKTLGRVLVTSRAPLNLTLERLVRVQPLPQPAAVELFGAFVEAAGSEQPGDRASVAEICRRVDGLPLAIELAAARTRTLAVDEIRDHLDRRLALLTEGAADLPERQRSMSATVAWSYDLLDSGARRLLEQLSVFAGGWTLDDAAAICTGVDIALDSARLVDSSLIAAETAGGRRRYGMLDTVREYAAGRLLGRAGRDGAAALRDSHAAHFAALATDSNAGLRGPRQQDVVEGLRANIDNLRVALDHLLTTRQLDQALQMGAALWMFWRSAGAFSEGRAWLTRLLAEDSAGLEAVRAPVLWGAGWLAFHQGAYDETAQRGDQLAGWGRRSGDGVALRNGLTLRSLQRIAAGDYHAAAELCEEALRLARAGNDDWLLATSALNRAVPALHLGDLVVAERLLADAAGIYERLGDTTFRARVDLQAVFLRLLKGETSTAAELASHSVASVWRLGDHWAVAEQLDGAAAVAAARGNAAGAALIAGAAESAWESLAAVPHPADRTSVDRWLAPALAAEPDGGRSALDTGRRLTLSEAVEAVSELLA